MVLGRDPPPLVLADEGPVGDAQQRIVRPVHVAFAEIDVVGGHQRCVAVIGPGHQARLRQRFARLSVALQLDIEAVVEHPPHLIQRRRPFGLAAGGEQGIDRPVRAAGEKEQPFGVLGHPAPGHARLFGRADLQKGGRGQGHQVQIAGLVLGQQHHGGDPRPLVGRPLAYARHRQGAADDRLDPRILGVAGKLQRPEQIGPVGQPHRRHVRRRGQLADRISLDRAFQQGIGRAHPKMHEPQFPALGHAMLLLRAATPDSAHVLNHRQHHPNEAPNRSKRQRVPSQPNHVNPLWRTCCLFVLILVLFRASS